MSTLAWKKNNLAIFKKSQHKLEIRANVESILAIHRLFENFKNKRNITGIQPNLITFQGWLDNIEIKGNKEKKLKDLKFFKSLMRYIQNFIKGGKALTKLSFSREIPQGNYLTLLGKTQVKLSGHSCYLSKIKKRGYQIPLPACIRV